MCKINYRTHIPSFLLGAFIVIIAVAMNIDSACAGENRAANTALLALFELPPDTAILEGTPLPYKVVNGTEIKITSLRFGEAIKVKSGSFCNTFEQARMIVAKEANSGWDDANRVFNETIGCAVKEQTVFIPLKIVRYGKTKIVLCAEYFKFPGVQLVSINTYLMTKLPVE